MKPDGTDDWAFHAVLALLFAHELDAVERNEWRLLPGLRSLPDGLAGRLFVLLHAPLFIGLFRLATHPSPRVRGRFRRALCVFAVVHAALHRRFRGHPDYEFEGPTSWVPIHGAALAGLVHLLRSRRPGRTTR